MSVSTSSIPSDPSPRYGTNGLFVTRAGRAYRCPVTTLWCIRQEDIAPLGVIEQVLDGGDVRWRYVDPWAGQPLPDISEVGGLVVLGGTMNADAVDEHPWLGDVRALVAEAASAERPILGVCLGAQVLTRALGAAVFAAPVREIGFRKVTATDAGARDPLLGAFAPSSLVMQWHEDACELPASAELLAEGDDVAVQAFRAGERAYGVQFHFEVTREIVASWCDDASDESLRQVWGSSAAEVLAQVDAHLAAQQVAGRRLTEAFVDLLR